MRQISQLVLVYSSNLKVVLCYHHSCWPFLITQQNEPISERKLKMRLLLCTLPWNVSLHCDQYLSNDIRQSKDNSSITHKIFVLEKIKCFVESRSVKAIDTNNLITLNFNIIYRNRQRNEKQPLRYQIENRIPVSALKLSKMHDLKS